MRCLASQPSFAPLILAALLAATPAEAQPAGPFAGFAGSWVGDGTVRLANGSSGRIHCEASYAAADDTLEQSLRCAGGKNRFEFRIQLENNGGAIVGTWDELTRRVEGGVSGHAANGVIQTLVRGQGFTADVTIETRGARQTVEIRAHGGDVSSASIVLRRGR